MAKMSFECAVASVVLSFCLSCGVRLMADAAPADAFRVADAIVVKAVFADRREAAAIAATAADLTNAIFRTTGKMPAVYVDGSEPADAKAAIHLGPTTAAKAAGLMGEGLRKGDWRIRCEPSRAFLYGRTPFAVTCATFEFMETTCDYHVLTIEGDDVSTPDPNCTAKVCDRTVRPAIYGRTVYHSMFNAYRHPFTKRYWDRYSRAMRSTTPSDIEGQYRVSRKTRGCHSSFDYLPPDKWFKDHPEYYSMGPDGKRHGTPNAQSQLCYTNPDVYRLVLESLERFVAEDRKENPDDPPLVYDFTQQDNSNFLCLCPECRKVIAKYDRKEGGHADGGDAGLQLEFVNRLARDIRAKYPDVQVRTFAYVSSERAPKPGTITVEPNVRIWWCDVYSHSDHTLPLRTPGHYNERQAQELDEWLALTRNVQVWDYMLYTDAFPELSPDAIKADAAYFASNGIPLIFMETEYRGQPLYELNYYLLSRLYIDPSLDVDALMRTFCRSYGPVADEMYDALQYLRREIVAKHAPTAQEWHIRVLPWLVRPDTVRNFAAKVQSAYDKTPPGSVRSRLARTLASSWKHLVTTYKKDPSAAVAYAEAQANYRKYGLETAQTAFMEPKSRDAAAKMVEETLDLLTLKFDDLPDELKDVPDTDVFCVDYHHGGTARRMEDPLSRRKFAVSAPDYKKMPVPCGVYDRSSKDSFNFRIKAADLTPGEYRWVKLGRCHVGRSSYFWFPGSWRSSFALQDCHMLADGMAVDPNWYEIWASAREGEGVFLIDRLLLRRVKPEG